MADPVDRRMAYPYTLTSKVATFPWKFYLKHNWFFRWWMIGIGISIPFFAWIQKKSYSPENVRAFAEKAEREKAKHAH